MRMQSDFLKSLPITAGIIGNKLGVEVCIGNCAKTDGQTITLPATLDERDISRNELLGFLIHEAAHVRFTKMFKHSELSNLLAQCPIAFSLLNCIEDARIEKLICKEYAGARFFLDQAHESASVEMCSPEYKWNAPTALGMYLLLRCEQSYHPEVTPTTDAVRNKFVQFFGEDIAKAVDKELECFPKLTSTRDVIKCVNRIIALLQSKLDDMKQDAQQGGQSGSGQEDSENDKAGEQQGSSGQSNASQSSDGGSSQQNSGDGNSCAGSQEGCSGQESNANSSAESNDGDGNSSSSAEQQQSGKNGSATTDDKAGAGKKKGTKKIERSLTSTLSNRCRIDESFDLSKAIQKKLNELKKDDPDAAGCGSSSPTTYGKVVPPMTYIPSMENRQTLKKGNERLARAKMDSVVARRALLGILQAKSREGVYTANSGRRIQVSRLSRLTTGSTKIFERREEVPAIDTSVSLLLDLSGSVGKADDMAIRAALALIYAMQSIPKTKAALTVFPGCIGQRGEACVTMIPFGSKPEKYAHGIGSLTSGGSTPLAETLVQTCVELSKRHEHRKIIIVVTDGCINENARTMLAKVAKSGMTLVGIGVGQHLASNFFSEAFPISAVIKDFSELQNALMNISKQVLLHNN